MTQDIQAAQEVQDTLGEEMDDGFPPVDGKVVEGIEAMAMLLLGLQQEGTSHTLDTDDGVIVYTFTNY